MTILKGVGKIDGDGYKDTTRKGEVVFVWNEEKQPPYAPGQYPRIGNEGWSASTRQYDFTPATVDEVRALLSAGRGEEGVRETSGLREALDAILREAVEPDDPKATSRFFLPDDSYGDRARAVSKIIALSLPAGGEDEAVRPITMQDVRLRVGEGDLTPHDVLNGANAELSARSRISAARKGWAQ